MTMAAGKWQQPTVTTMTTITTMMVATVRMTVGREVAVAV